MEGHFMQLVLKDAKSWVDQAKAFYLSTGKEIALAEFSNPRGRFASGEQYVYVLGTTGMMLAHPVNEDFVGKDFYRIQDPEGKYFIKEIIDSANTKGFGWVEYKWYDPATKKEQPKTVYFEKVDSMIFCSGVYGGNPVSEIYEQEPDELAVHEIPADSVLAFSNPSTDIHIEEEEMELVPDDAKRWVKKAIVFFKANGNGTGLAQFSNPSGRFVRNGQYVYVLDFNGAMLAHPVNEKFVGKDFYHIQDSDGKSFIKEIVDTANNGGSGWVEYKWFNPATKRVEPKTVYFEKFNNTIFCSGVYER
jgi:cytochrome c